ALFKTRQNQATEVRTHFLPRTSSVSRREGDSATVLPGCRTIGIFPGAPVCGQLPVSRKPGFQHKKAPRSIHKTTYTCCRPTALPYTQPMGKFTTLVTLVFLAGTAKGQNLGYIVNIVNNGASSVSVMSTADQTILQTIPLFGNSTGNFAVS